MKKKSLFGTIIICLITIGYYACKKAETNISTPAEQAKNVTVLKIYSWLDNQSAKLDSNGQSKVKLLKQNLQFQNLSTEDFAKGESFIVVPISSRFQSANNTDKKINSVLLLFVSDTGIRKANIVQYYGENSQPVLKKGVFTEIFNSRIPDFSGTISFLSITDSRKYDMTYGNGKMLSHSLAQNKQDSSVTGRVSQCWNTYWVTYYSDGSTDWQFLYSYCDGGLVENCKTFRVNNGIALKGECGGGSSAPDCCIADPNMQLSSVTMSGDAGTTYGPESPGVDGGSEKTNSYKWSYTHSSIGWYNWTNYRVVPKTR